MGGSKESNTNMKTLNTIAFLIACLVACGGESPTVDGIELGTLEQPVYMPVKYGIEGVTNWEGSPDFGRECEGSTPAQVADDWCSVPNSKTIKFRWFPSTCPLTGSYGTAEGFRQVVYEAIINWQSEMTLLGWDMYQTGEDFQLKCETVAGTPMGRFQPGPEWDQIGAPYGTLGQYKTGRYQIDFTDIAAWAQALAPGSASARYNIVYNLVRHELWHSSGLGHSAAGAGPALMNEAPNGTWVTIKQPSASQLDRVECYNPANGGLFSDC